MTPHLNRLVETVQMRGHNICFYTEVTKIISNYHQILPYLELCHHRIFTAPDKKEYLRITLRQFSTFLQEDIYCDPSSELS